MGRDILRQLIYTRPFLAGLLFCLASTRCRAFILPCYNTAPCKRLQRILSRTCSYTASAAKQRTGLYSGFSCDLPHFTTANNRPTQAAIIPPAPRWSVSQRPDDIQRVPDTSATPDAAQVSTAPYCNKAYKMVQHIADHANPAGQPGGGLDASHARRFAIWPGSAVIAYRVNLAPYTRRGIPVAWARRAARNHWRLPPQLFSGFRPIANRDQQ